MTTKLAPLRSNLESLRMRRTLARLTTAYSGFLAAAVWIVLVSFLLDWSFAMDRPQRVVLLLLGAWGLVYSFRRFASPQLRRKETLLQTALLVERSQGIDSDLVAAIEFENPEAEGWGSVELQDEVKTYVAGISDGIDMSGILSADTLGRRLVTFLLSAALIGVLGYQYPGFAMTFLNRLMLSTDHYPTDTTIEKIVIGADEVDVRTGFIVNSEGKKNSPSGPYGKPLEFRVECTQKDGTGGLPETIRVALEGGSEADLVLGKEDGKGVYTGTIARLTNKMECRIEAGDAFTDPFDILLIALPVVKVELASTDPVYAAEGGVDVVNECDLIKKKNTSCEPGNLQIEVKEGAMVDMAIAVTDDEKILQKPLLEIRGKTYEFRSEKVDGKTIWMLPVKDTPLEVVQKRLNYRILVADQYGLHPEPTIEGVIQVKTDKPPRVRASMVSRFVLPAAAPIIDYEARDDYGIGKVRILVEVSRQQQEAKKEAPIEVPGSGEQKLSKRLKDRHACDLKSYGLKKGDVVRLFVEVTDDRGELEGESSRSEVLSVKVTDRPGLLKAINELDERSVRQLDAIIEKELGIGDSK